MGTTVDPRLVVLAIEKARPLLGSEHDWSIVSEMVAALGRLKCDFCGEAIEELRTASFAQRLFGGYEIDCGFCRCCGRGVPGEDTPERPCDDCWAEERLCAADREAWSTL